MDARDTVTVEEGDRYPLGPPSYGDVAQLVEQRTENSCVTGSIPVAATKKTPRIIAEFFYGLKSEMCFLP